VVSSAGSFTSAQAVVAETLLKEKYANLKHWSIMEGKTYLFELLFPLNKIVVDYGGEEKLVLLAVRDTDTGNELDDILMYAKGIGFDVVEEVHLNIDELKNEVKRKDFINKEGFVVVFENGFRVKIKYEEYFRLHKIICNVNEKFVWEFVSQDKPISLENIPDETFQFIKNTVASLNSEFQEKKDYILGSYVDAIRELNESYGKGNWVKKDFAICILPKYKKISGALFHLYENRYDAFKKNVWDSIKPEYEPGQSGFQSMKIEA